MKETIFDSLPVIGKSLAEIKPSDKYREKCPAGSALAMSIAQNAVQLKKQNKLLTVICADPSDVIRLQDEVTWFDPSLKLTVFPDWETLPYDVLSPHADLVGERLQTLYLLVTPMAGQTQGGYSKQNNNRNSQNQKGRGKNGKDKFAKYRRKNKKK